jgi:hypothetical protein
MKNVYVFGNDCPYCKYLACPVSNCDDCPNCTNGNGDDCNCLKEAPVDGLHCPYYKEA